MPKNFYETIYDRKEPYVIAEIGSNHNGNMEMARKLITEAHNAGADCIKFQSWSKETIFAKEVYEKNYFLNDDYRNRNDYTLEQIVEEFSISESQLIDMKLFSDSIGIDCTSTPFSKKEVDFLVEKMNVKFIKIASMDLNNYPFLEYVAGKKKPIVISTGLSELSEIDKAVRTIERKGNYEIIILHCISIYPPEDKQVNLKNMETLAKIYGYPVGFSDHTLGYSIPLAAIALGAKIIEKHFTLDKNLFGWDHKVSATPDEMNIICNEGKRIVTALGINRIYSHENDERKQAFRRSIVTTRKMNAGEIISEDDIDFKRPGTGLTPEEIKYVVGRTLKKNIEKDQVLYWDFLI